MTKMPFEEVSIQLDRLFFSPFSEGESAEMRAIAIEQFIQLNGWNWDQILEELYKPKGN